MRVAADDDDEDVEEINRSPRMVPWCEGPYRSLARVAALFPCAVLPKCGAARIDALKPRIAGGEALLGFGDSMRVGQRAALYEVGATRQIVRLGVVDHLVGAQQYVPGDRPFDPTRARGRWRRTHRRTSFLKRGSEQANRVRN